MISDIKSAFLNVRVNQKDRDFLRFLWIDDIHKENPEVVAYRFASVLFGLSPSPFLLNATISLHMEKYKETDYEIVRKFLADLYCDDSVSGAQTLEEAFELYLRSKRMLSEGGFNLRKWNSNDVELMEKMEGMEWP